jgi:hypothetical protein
MQVFEMCAEKPAVSVIQTSDAVAREFLTCWILKSQLNML